MKDNYPAKLVRVKGGFWVAEGQWPVDSDKPPTVECFGTNTATGLANKGILLEAGRDKWKWIQYRLYCCPHEIRWPHECDKCLENIEESAWPPGTDVEEGKPVGY